MTAEGAPERLAVVEIERHDRLPVLRGLHRLARHLGRLVGQRAEDAARVQPPRALALEDRGPVDVAGFQLRNGGVAAIGATDTGPNAETALDEVEAVAGLAADAVVLHPADVRLIDAALGDQSLHEPDHRVVGERRAQGGVHAEAALQAARDIVFAAALPYAKLASGVNTPFPGVQTQHHFAERNEIPAAATF